MNFNFPHITLNLANPEKSDLSFVINKYPDGQRDIVLSYTNGLELIKDIKVPVVIKSRFNSAEDLNIIKCAKACLKRLKIKEVHLYIPYLLGARADRKFVEGGCSYLVDVIAPDLNNLGFESITVVDVHSEVSPAAIPNIENISVLPELTKLALEEVNVDDSTKSYVISPDAGASKRTFETAKSIQGYDIEIVECAKHRDLATGKILSTVVPINDFGGADEVVVDDICSKGGTFMGIASKLSEKNAGNIYLVVAHYEGTADIEQLKASGIKKIFTTNSVVDLKEEKYKDFIHQIDVF